jgi:hypothetical protein
MNTINGIVCLAIAWFIVTSVIAYLVDYSLTGDFWGSFLKVTAFEMVTVFFILLIVSGFYFLGVWK